MKNFVALYELHQDGILICAGIIFVMQAVSLLRSKALPEFDPETEAPTFKNSAERAITSRLKAVAIGIIVVWLARSLAQSIGIEELPDPVTSFLNGGTMLVIGYLPAVIVGFLVVESIGLGRWIFVPILAGYVIAAIWWGAFWFFVLTGAAGISFFDQYNVSMQIIGVAAVMGLISVGSVLFQYFLMDAVMNRNDNMIAVYASSFMTAVCYVFPLLIAAAALSNQA